MSLYSNPKHPAAPAGLVKEKFALPLCLVPSLTDSAPTSDAASMSASTVQASIKKAQAPKFPADAALNRAMPGAPLVTASVPVERSISEPAFEAVATAVKTRINVSNAEFVAAVFPSLTKDASPLVCSKYGDPTTGAWPAMKAGQVDKQCLPGWNNYFNCSSGLPDSFGSYKAQKSLAADFCVLMLDDCGTKVPWSRLGEFKPSYAIETSPGNYQIGIILATPLTDGAFITQLQNAVIADGLCDPGATGQTRWARLPVGINGKAKYKSESGEPFQCRLARWNPERRYSVDQIVAGLKLTLAPVTPHLQHVATDTSNLANVASPASEVNPADAAKVPQLLTAIDPDCGREDWIRVLMAVHHTTGGSDAGLALVDAWSSRCQARYKDFKDVEVQWKSLDHFAGAPITIGTLIRMAREAGADVRGSIMGVEAFEPNSTSVSESKGATAGKAMILAPGVAQPLVRFSLRDCLAELERAKVEQTLILGEIVLLGQATVIYALANTGKTLIIIYLIIEAVKKNLIDPSRLIYINMDDNSSGLVDKVRLLAEFGCHMVADGHKGFAAKEFRTAMVEMIETNTARGSIVVLDTLKKFVNTMNKDESRKFTSLVRRFSLMGGTVIALSHANKNPGSDGKIKYTGTTDIVDDFDCAYTVETVAQQVDGSQKVVEFTNIKRRGDVALTAAYSYSLERGLSYDALLTTVQAVDPLQLLPIKQAAELQSDAVVIAAIESCIADGIVSKMKLADDAAKRANVSKRVALKVIEKYTGADPSTHRWAFVVRARGAKVFELLARPTAPTPAVPGTPVHLPVDRAQAQQNTGLPEPVEAAALTEEERFHMEILREANQLYGDVSSTEGQAQVEY